MTFTYAGDLSTNLAKVRFYIQDTVEDTGVKPDASNFTDEELTGTVAIEGSWQRAVAGVFEILTGLFGQEVDIAVGPRRESLSQASDRYGMLAKRWRARHGSGTSAAGVRHVTPVDGYSNDVSTDEQ